MFLKVDVYCFTEEYLKHIDMLDDLGVDPYTTDSYSDDNNYEWRTKYIPLSTIKNIKPIEKNELECVLVTVENFYDGEANEFEEKVYENIIINISYEKLLTKLHQFGQIIC